MKRFVVLLGTLSVLALPASASAQADSYYLSRAEAVSITRNFLHRMLGYHHTAAHCRPQGANRPRPGYVYHRWVCGWAAGDSYPDPDCVGSSLVRGSSDPDAFYWRVLHYEGECQYGWDN